MGKYEDKSLSFYTEGNQHKLILGDSTNDLLNNLLEMVK